MFTPEQLYLLQVAMGVWNKLGTAKRIKMPFGEESVTENLLLDLAVHYPGEAIIIPFDKHQEGKNGADWAWSFESADRSYSFPMMVQAKILDKNDQEYAKINRKIGQSQTLQIDKLLQVSKQLGFPAFYAFYNHLSDVTRIPSKCNSLTTSVPQTWGVALALASDVKKVLNDQSFDTHRLHSAPLHCLLCSAGTGLKGPKGSPDLIAQSLRSRRQSDGAQVDGDAGGFRDFVPRSDSHPLFENARKIASDRRETGSSDLLEKLKEEYPGIDGVVILRDAQ